MSEHKPSDFAGSGDLPPEPDEVGAAVRDVSYRLTHDLSDTSDDLRDAAALAPLAAIKLAQRYASAIAARPKRTFLAIAGLAGLVVAGATWLRRKRS